jgi:hypothetical protein
MAKDILLDQNGDLLIVDGDLVIGNSEQQDVDLIFSSHKGEYKEHPLLGFGASRYLKKSNNNVEEFVRELELQLELNGFENPEIDVEKGLDNIKINI